MFLLVNNFYFHLALVVVVVRQLFRPALALRQPPAQLCCLQRHQNGPPSEPFHLLSHSFCGKPPPPTLRIIQEVILSLAF